MNSQRGLSFQVQKARNGKQKDGGEKEAVTEEGNGKMKK